MTRAQLLGLGLTRTAIQHRQDSGTLIRVHAGVYAVGHVPRHPQARAMAALLACGCGDGDGAGAALSHWSAAAVWGITDWPATLELSSPLQVRRPGLLVHRSQTLRRGDVRMRSGLRVTSPVRTMLDLQGRVADGRLIRLVNDLRVAGDLREAAFRELCARSRRIDRLLGDGDLTRSALEDLFRRFVARCGLPMPEINARITIDGSAREVDALYREARLIVELDSWRYHGDRVSFERDRSKDAAALAAGYRTLRTTARRLRDGGIEEAATIRTILAA